MVSQNGIWSIIWSTKVNRRVRDNLRNDGHQEAEYYYNLVYFDMKSIFSSTLISLSPNLNTKSGFNANFPQSQ